MMCSLTGRNKFLMMGMTLVFCALLVLPVAFYSRAAQSGGEMKIRSVNEPSEFSISRFVSWIRQTRNDFNENFGFRSYLVSLYNYMNYYLRINGNEKVINGFDKWLFLGNNDALEDVMGQNLFTQTELEQWKKYLNIRQHAFDGLGIKYVYVMAPDKHMIHDEKLPERFRPVQGKTRADQWYRFMRSESDANIINLTQALRDSHYTLPVYSATDTHWSEYGSAVSQEVIMNVLNSMGMDFRVRHYLPGDFEMRLHKGGDLARMMNLQTFFSGNEPFNRKVRGVGVSRLKLKQNTLYARTERLFKTPTARTDLRCLLIGDSFVNALFSDLFQYFKYVMCVRLHNHQQRHLDPFVKYIDECKPDVIIELRVTRGLKSLIPEDPPEINFKAYPDWLKCHFPELKRTFTPIPVLKQQKQTELLMAPKEIH